MMSNSDNKLLEILDLKQYFPIQRGFLRRTVGYTKAVNGVSLTLGKNETLGLVGESGCGKTTLGRSILRLYNPTGGKVFYYKNGEKLSVLELNRRGMRDIRAEMQIIFQDPFSSLNERMTVLQNVGEPLLVNGIASGRRLEERVEQTILQVGLKHEHLHRYPLAFSGGQRQRIGIARALVVQPRFVVADEAVSALDVSIQAQTLNLLKDLQEQYSLTFLFISHDLSVVRYISDRIAVMYVGKIVEIASRDDLLLHPYHPYTEALLSAIPRADIEHHRNRIVMPGTPADPSNLPTGCAFHPRCGYAQEICKQEVPEWKKVDKNHFASCHLAEDLILRGVSAEGSANSPN